MTPRDELRQHEDAIAVAQQNSAMDAIAAARARAAADEARLAARLARERQVAEDDARKTVEARTIAE